MPIITRTPTTAGAVYSDAGANNRRKYIVERVTVTTNASYLTLKSKLPASAAIVWASLAINSGNLVLANSTLTASILADQIDLVAGTAPPTTSGTSSVTSGVIARSGATLTAGTKWCGGPGGSTIQYKENTATVDHNLYLIPTDAGGSEDYNVNTTPSNGYNFGVVTGEIDVVLFYEDFSDVTALIQH